MSSNWWLLQYILLHQPQKYHNLGPRLLAKRSWLLRLSRWNSPNSLVLKIILSIWHSRPWVSQHVEHACLVLAPQVDTTAVYSQYSTHKQFLCRGLSGLVVLLVHTLISKFFSLQYGECPLSCTAIMFPSKKYVPHCQPNNGEKSKKKEGQQKKKRIQMHEQGKMP